ncbi:hypothetical protein PSN45_002791 [Yamadazyma tenuis]|uniref:Uncharacterized protein n=1 Tax=Candida tenuis (strain ATCC 10573 / BCRC 21748 / CBS 615 / JCM 9827 / NBRC 10315 / NRRL Y-1498 / VKM Y-70) TaxID=590646 RepID=G3AWR2_CANTC|nr:uncharacterized protein CANTEDRAFT_117672 [Yamadazyma tenuis ATCC 10573]XP_006683851.1 uncharacterized protein CANTEDRAFT_117672 [Yamadazyma tenuis ATCC 10573]EGV66592.1 hypothetical protein CANTEDRAFT_117672 [Yamadazyma tenuis ATCC 10573]EGV66593.1 hypothetical protein CANTEDRAFT_117672 [Yamadazyma tenuis ATCC 10573]WEJ95278.1 hypothetical protein PSN45_002791 [Yamadazyma tenuis]
MSLTPEIVAQDVLFAGPPPTTSGGSFKELYESIRSKSSVDSILGQTYTLIRTSTDLNDSITLWEIRLLVLVFNNRITQAKYEAVCLNNVLYLAENDNVAPAAVSSIPPNPQNQRVYPLPRNNNGVIDHKFLVLLLRLKSVPNMSLVNEFYKLCYQLRLKSDNYSSDQLSVKLMNLSFDISVILIINKDYLTLLNLLDSMKSEIELDKSELYASVLSGVKLLSILTKILIFDQTQTPRDAIKRQLRTSHSDDFHLVVDSALDDLVYVLNNISPIYSATLTEKDERTAATDISKADIDLDRLVSMVLEGKITGRILCSLLGMWDLKNNFKFAIEESEFLGEDLVSISNPTVSDCCALIRMDWLKHINKVYGLE